MTLATELRKLRESRAYYAAAGAGDLAVEKLREVPDALSKLQQRTDAKEIGGAAVAYVAHVGARAVEVFDGLAERGRKVVADGGPKLIKRAPELDKAAKATVRRVKETATTAKDTAKTAAVTAGETAKEKAKKSGKASR